MRTIAATVVALAACTLAGCQYRLSEYGLHHYIAGKLAADRQDYRTALAELTKAVAIDPKLTAAYTATGDLYRKQGQYEKAAAAYERACALDAYAFRPHYNLGVTYQLLAQSAGGAGLFAEYIAKAVRVYLRAVTIRPHDFDANLNLSACYFQQGKYDLAEQYCRASMALSPDNPHARANLAVIYDAQNRPYDAIRAYRQSLERDAHQPSVLFQLGLTYMRVNRLRDALNAFELAARQDPRWPAPWVQIGTCRFYQKQYDAALAAYTKAIELDRNCDEGYRGLGVVYMTQYIQDPAKAALRDKALAAWNRSLELDPNQEDLRKLVAKYTPRLTGPGL